MRPIPCVGAIVRDDQDRVLLVRRGNEPARGCWSIPGGRRERGETDEAAAVREIREETGLRVQVDRYVGSVEREAPGGAVYLVRDYLCSAVNRTDLADVRPGDDAVDVGWFHADDLRRLECSPGLVEALDGWGMLDVVARARSTG